jgi:hypothetical protein
MKVISQGTDVNRMVGDCGYDRLLILLCFILRGGPAPEIENLSTDKGLSEQVF